MFCILSALTPIHFCNKKINCLCHTYTGLSYILHYNRTIFISSLRNEYFEQCYQDQSQSICGNLDEIGISVMNVVYVERRTRIQSNLNKYVIKVIMKAAIKCTLRSFLFKHEKARKQQCTYFLTIRMTQLAKSVVQIPFSCPV